MKPTIFVLVMLETLIPLSAFAAEPAVFRFNFDTGPAGHSPTGFELGRTGRGALGKWVIKAEKDAPSGPHVLAQLDADDVGDRFPAAFTGPKAQDLRLSVKCKMVAGRVDQACGLVFRLKDANNYYIARANALEGNVRIYRVVEGKRTEFGSWKGEVPRGVWQELAVEAKGNNFQVIYNGNQIIEASDKTFTEPGKFGVWTKADSITYFDDLVATPG